MVTHGWDDVVVAGRVPGSGVATGVGRGSGEAHPLQQAAARVRPRGRLAAGRVAHFYRPLLGSLSASVRRPPRR